MAGFHPWRVFHDLSSHQPALGLQHLRSRTRRPQEALELVELTNVSPPVTSPGPVTGLPSGRRSKVGY
jgi:hypothetical protein